jgi:3-hydroxy-3-methylglutaryl CoA synthase
MSDAVGIDDLNLYASTLRVEALELAAARGFSEAAMARQQLIGRALPPAWEDPVTLAVNAALPIVEDAGRDAFELLIVATESGVDYGKPLSSYVHRYLGLPVRCRNLEVKHACYGGTAALQLAASWVRSGARPGTRALIVTSDMGRCMFGHLAEATEGAGAVAMAVAAQPRILELDTRAGYASREIYDVSRPTPTLERGNPELSLGAYLDLLELAYEAYRDGDDFRVEDRFTHVLYHTPFVALVEQAHRVLLELDDHDVAVSAAKLSFERMVRPSLRYCQQIGNIYAGSLYAALAGLLDSDDAPPAGSRIGMFSYGSGSCAEFYSGRVAPQAQVMVRRRGIAEHLAARRRATFGEYESIMCATEQGMTSAAFEPDRSAPPGLFAEAYDGRQRLVLESVRDYYRDYAWS